MDIIDIMLAKAMTPQGQIATYAAQAQQAVTRANAAVSATESLTSTLTADITAAEELLTALEGAAPGHTDAEIIALIHNEIESLTASSAITQSNDLYLTNITLQYDADHYITFISQTLSNTTGTSNDYGMTQKAITDALNALSTRIDNIPTTPSGDNNNSYINEAIEDADEGNIVITDGNGGITAGFVTEDNIIRGLIKTGTYTAQHALGLDIDYNNKVYTRTQGAPASDYFNYNMYRRMRCNVDNDGTILAFATDSSYRDDGSNGQVMVYQPKFYYNRTPVQTHTTDYGIVIDTDRILISDFPQPGFSLHPLFYNTAGQELDYVLVGAFEACEQNLSTGEYNTNDSVWDIANDYRTYASIADVKPKTGYSDNSLTPAKMNNIANKRGAGWSITTIEEISAEQMLSMVEFGTLNMQIGSGLSGLVNLSTVSGANGTSNTGSTGDVTNGNWATVKADSTVNIVNNVTNTYYDAGKTAISYRGIENPWGNAWKVVGNMQITGNASKRGGTPVYKAQTPIGTFVLLSLSFTVPNSSSWIAAFGYDEQFPWIFLPIESGGSANSTLPVGDYVWVSTNLNNTNTVMVGGHYSAKDSSGPFYYAFDNGGVGPSTSCRIMYTPQSNTSTTYRTNIEKWTSTFANFSSGVMES